MSVRESPLKFICVLTMSGGSTSKKETLKKWHGWVATSAFKVGTKLVPDRKRIMEVIGGSGNLGDDMMSFCNSFAPVLAEIHKHLASVCHDNHRIA